MPSTKLLIDLISERVFWYIQRDGADKKHKKLKVTATVVDRQASLSDAIKGITAEPIKVVYNVKSDLSTEKEAYSLLAPGGSHLRFPMPPFPAEVDPSKKVMTVIGSAMDPEHKDTAVSLYNKLPAILAAGDLKPNRFEVLPNGLAGIEGGLARLESGEVSALKLVAHPQEV